MNRKEWVSPANTDKNTSKTYFYDDKGRLIKSVNHLNDCRYSFDNNGRIIRQAFYLGDEQTGYIDYVYDDNDNVNKTAALLDPDIR
jgi:YD repeat-containing protein